MSLKYNEYIKDHKENVRKAYEWLRTNIPSLFQNPNLQFECEALISSHDNSKFIKEEYDAYDAYFYGGNRSYEVVEEFNKAWLHHIHNNPHHWQHWVLINDNPDEGEIILDMPDHYIIEMICDWLSFAIAKDHIGEIFEWYDAHAKHMKLSDHTRLVVEDILEKIDLKLSGEDV